MNTPKNSNLGEAVRNFEIEVNKFIQATEWTPMNTLREPKILFRIPFTLYWLGCLPKEFYCCGYKYLAIFKRKFNSANGSYYFEEI